MICRRTLLLFSSTHPSLTPLLYPWQIVRQHRLHVIPARISSIYTPPSCPARPSSAGLIPHVRHPDRSTSHPYLDRPRPRPPCCTRRHSSPVRAHPSTHACYYKVRNGTSNVCKTSRGTEKPLGFRGVGVVGGRTLTRGEKDL